MIILRLDEDHHLRLDEDRLRLDEDRLRLEESHPHSEEEGPRGRLGRPRVDEGRRGHPDPHSVSACIFVYIGARAIVSIKHDNPEAPPLGVGTAYRLRKPASFYLFTAQSKAKMTDTTILDQDSGKRKARW